MEKKKYWLCISDLINWEVIKENKIYGVIPLHKKFLDLIKPGDKVIIYVVPKKIGGFFKVVDRKLREDLIFKGGEFPFRVKLKKEYVPKYFLELNVKIINNMKLFDNCSWGPRLMGRSIINIVKQDYDYLLKLSKE